MTPETQEVREMTRAAHAKAIAEHGDLCLCFEAYANRLTSAIGRCVGRNATDVDRIGVLRTLHTSDLYLCAACAAGVDEAWARLRMLHKRYITELFRWIQRSDGADEAAESLITDLFLPDRSGQSRIGSYDGRSSLLTWLKVVVTNRLINERHRAARDRLCVSSFPDLPDRSTVDSVEARLRRGRYAPLLERCLPEACQCLTAKEALILLWRFDDDLQLGHIARLMSIHQSTVTRQMEKGLRRLRRELETMLASRHDLDSEAIRECLRLLVNVEQESLSIFSVIRRSRDTIRMKEPTPAELSKNWQAKARAI